MFSIVGVGVLALSRPKAELRKPSAESVAPPSGNNDKRALKLVGGIFLPVGMGLLLGAWYTGNQQSTILKSWPIVDAQVTKSRMTRQRSSSGSTTTTYSAEMEFRYNANGKEYMTPRSLGYSTSNSDGIRKMVSDYAPGSHHPIRYNPSNPNDIRFDAGYNFGFFFLPILLGGMGLVFSALGAGLLLASRAGCEHRCPSCGQCVEKGQKVCPNGAAPLEEDVKPLEPQ